MVYNNNQNIDESSGKMDDPAQNMGESIQDVDKSAANQKRDESGRGMTEPEPNQIKAASESDQDMDEDEDIDIGFHFEDTSNIDVPKLLIDQVLGQEHAVEVVKKAASQRRHIMMIGTPGTGKSLLAKAMAELLPKEELKDILVYPNMEDLNNPKIREVPAGKGREIVMAHKMEARKKAQARNMLMMLFVVGIIIYSYFVAQLLWGIIAGIMILMLTRQFLPKEEMMIPKMAVSNYDKEHAPYIDATGAHAGALLGDVRHDPFQSGGLETPAHDRVEAGDIHKAH